MLEAYEIKQFMEEDMASRRKRQARTGQRYYEGQHDIEEYRMFYYNADGILEEDQMRANVKISHPFFTELVEQATQYILSGDDGYMHTDEPKLQKILDARFNDNDDFNAELSDVITDAQVKGFGYIYAMKDAAGHLVFNRAVALKDSFKIQ